jgi:hypothetical protein
MMYANSLLKHVVLSKFEGLQKWLEGVQGVAHKTNVRLFGQESHRQTNMMM